MNPTRTVLELIHAINTHHVDDILALMPEDCIFIDTYGNKQTKQDMETNWQNYFAWFPDYAIEVSDMLECKDKIAVFGFASGSYHGQAGKHWRIPAAWKAVMRNGKIKLWQVYADSKLPQESME